jgi:hypothetical protein
MLKAEHHAERDRERQRIGTGGGFIKPLRHRAPGRALAVRGREVLFFRGKRVTNLAGWMRF